MIKPKMIENEKDFHCSKGHQLPVVTIAVDPQLSRNQRLLCTECLEDTDMDFKVVGLRKIISLIEENQVKKIERVENIIKNSIQTIESLHGIIDQMKSFIIQQFNSLITIMMEWIQNLKQQGSLYSQYSFYEELEVIILKQNKTNTNQQILLQEIQKTNHCWSSKLNPKLEYFNQLVEYNKCKELLSNLEFGSNTFTQVEQQPQIKIELQQQKNLQNILYESEIKLKLIDQSVKQNDRCNAIVFDSCGQIMVSTENNDIKIWKFLNGKIEQIKILQGHTNSIQCLVYSKKQNSFISGANDNSIRCWKQLDSSDWITSEPYKEHTHCVNCIILNSNEDLLFSGSDDKSIKVWKVDFNQNILTYMYSLDKHNNIIIALSLNESETQLVSCAKDKNQIIIWERREQDKFEFKYFVKQSILDQGKKVKFIKNNQFIWVTGGKEIDKLCIFELKEGVFQENQDKTIQLIANNQIFDEYRFSIVYNKERNLMVVRHKTYIYIITEINDGKFKIVDQLNCDTYDVYGTITNNGQYLVYFDNKKKGYSTYELLNK
ncbi:unnamed protein product [Paramecium sonneborni]|uniref:Uncharacterized protein n=1 Tax=Paramecium sonneborni TaxID=65129 RepID=A0A8S1RTH5_9CILI|nr:unnamed protein product [Paramecium sonneborni]